MIMARHLLVLFAILSALASAGCTKWSEGKLEAAKVVKLTFVPSTKKTEIVLMPHPVFGSNGGVRFIIMPTPVTTGDRAHHLVEFECQHGRFVVDREPVWKRFQEGDDAVVIYRESIDPPGQFDFLDAFKGGEAPPR